MTSENKLKQLHNIMAQCSITEITYALVAQGYVRESIPPREEALIERIAETMGELKI